MRRLRDVKTKNKVLALQISKNAVDKNRFCDIIITEGRGRKEKSNERSLHMTKGNMTLKIEPELKEQAAALFKALGMDLSTATGIFFRQALRCNGLPFDVRIDEPNAITYAAMEAAEKEQDMFGPFDSVAELMEALNA